MSKKGAKSANIDAIVKEPEANGNAKEEPVKASSPEEMVTPEKAPSEEKTEEPEAEVAPAPEEPAAAPAPAAPAAPAAPPAPAVFVPKYKYTDGMLVITFISWILFFELLLYISITPNINYFPQINGRHWTNLARDATISDYWNRSEMILYRRTSLIFPLWRRLLG